MNRVKAFTGTAGVPPAVPVSSCLVPLKLMRQCRNVLRSPQIRGRTGAVVIVALHFPDFRVELPAGTAVQARSVRLAVQRKGSAHFFMPTPKQFRNPAGNSGISGRSGHLHDVWSYFDY